jgi:hypothetical protein
MLAQLAIIVCACPSPPMPPGSSSRWQGRNGSEFRQHRRALREGSLGARRCRTQSPARGWGVSNPMPDRLRGGALARAERSSSCHCLPDGVCRQPGAAGQCARLVPLALSHTESAHIPRTRDSRSACSADLPPCRCSQLRTHNRRVDGTHRRCSTTGHNLARCSNRVCRFDVGARRLVRAGHHNTANGHGPCCPAARHFPDWSAPRNGTKSASVWSRSTNGCSRTE